MHLNEKNGQCLLSPQKPQLLPVLGSLVLTFVQSCVAPKIASFNVS